MNTRPGTLPSFLEARIARIERQIQILTAAADVDLVEVDTQPRPNLREWEAACQHLADEVDG